jgi:hypothetical protein
MSHFPNAAVKTAAGHLDMTGGKVINLGSPTAATDGANKATVGATNPGSVGGSALFSAPNPADFAWINQGGATATFVDGVYCLRAPANPGGLAIRGLVAVLPAAPWTVTAALRGLGGYNNTFTMGLFLYDSVSTKIVSFGYYNNSGAGTLAGFKYSTPNNWAAEYNTMSRVRFCGPGHPWFQFRNDGANRVWNISQNGVYFDTVLTHGNTDYLTPTHAGFFAGPENDFPTHVDLVSWLLAPG